MNRRIAAWIIGVTFLMAVSQTHSVPWVIATDPATGVSSTSAVLNGHVANAIPGSYGVRFELGTSSGNYTDFFDADQSPIPGDGTTYYVTRTVPGLTSGQTYYYVVSLNTGTWTRSSTVQNFTTDAPLSVEMSSFTAQATQHGILLRWTTQSECDNLGFTTERRESDSNAWALVSDFASNPDLRGRGNTSGRTDYSVLDVGAQSGRDYDYRISETDAAGKITVKAQIHVSFTNHLLPSATTLDSAFPNPFNPETRISFYLSEDTPVSLSVLDLNGRTVRTLLVRSIRSVGRYDFRWDATDDSNRKVAGGVYLFLLRAGDKVLSQKVLLMK